MDVQFRALMESSKDAVFVVDAQTGCIVDCNASALLLLGTTSERIIGTHHAAMYPEELRAQYTSDFQRLASGESTSAVEAQLLRSDGETVWVEASGNVCEMNGRRLVLGIFRDITERRRAKGKLGRLNRILLGISACDEAIMQATDESELHARVTELMVKAKVCCRAALVCFHDSGPAIMAQTSADAYSLENADLRILQHVLDWPSSKTASDMPLRIVRYAEDRSLDEFSWMRAGGTAPGCLISLPIDCAGKELGALVLISNDPEAFYPREVEMLGRLTDHLRNGIEAIRARYERDKALHSVRYRLSLEAILTSAIREFFHLAGHDIDALVQRVWDKISLFLGVEHSFCIIFERGGLPEKCFEWHEQVKTDLDDAMRDTLTSQSFPWCREELCNGHTVVLGPKDDVFPGPQSELAEWRRLGIQSILLVPIEDEDQLAGIEAFYVTSRSHSWVQEDVEMLKSAGQIILGGVRRANSAKRLEESENHLRMVLDAASNGVLDTDLATGRVFYGENWARMLGYAPDEIEPTMEACLALVHPEDVAGIQHAFEAHALGLTPQYQAEFRLRNKRGEWQWVLSRGKIVEWDERGRPTRFLGAHTDISERKRVENALQWRDERHRALLEAIPDTLLRIRRDGEVLDVHVFDQAPLADMSRTTLGQRLFEVFPELVAEQTMHHIQRALDHDQSQVFEFPMEVSGTEHAFEARIVPTDDSEIMLILRDVSERNRLEREILEVSERERGRIGQDLHDGLGQQLVGIGFLMNALCSELERNKSPLAENAQGIAARLAEALEHSRSLARGLHVVGLENEGLRLALDELVSRTGSVYGVNARFSSRGVIKLSAEEANQMYRIAQEAVTNAVRHGKPGCIIVNLSQNEQRVRLTIEDDGLGFDPRGNPRKGMGLDIMHYRSRVVSGSLQIDSEPGHGTRVVFSLPFLRKSE
ncbi:MAG: PAS domain S-box protein [Candidatus Hydrogenedentota bacterium]